MAALGQPRPQDGAAVTCVAFSPQGQLLAAGHANGDLDFWEARRGAWELVKSVRDAHAAAILQVCHQHRSSCLHVLMRNARGSSRVSSSGATESVAEGRVSVRHEPLVCEATNMPGA